MSRVRKIFFNTASNILFQLFNMMATFIMMPLVLTYFGKEIFGINAYIVSLTAMFDVISFVVGMALMKYVPEYVAKGEFKKLNSLIVALLLLSFTQHLLIGALLFTFPYFGLDFFNIPPELQELTKNVMQLVGILIFIRFLTPISFGILTGLQKFHLKNIINSINSFSLIFAYLYVYHHKESLFYYVLIIQAGYVLVSYIQLFFAARKLPFKFVFEVPRLAEIKETIKYSTYLLSVKISLLLMYTTDRIIIQKTLGAVNVSIYHVAARINELSQRMLSLPMSAILPNLSDAFAKKEYKFINKTNVEGTWFYNLITIPALATLYTYLNDFINLWIGEGFELSINIGRWLVLTLMCTTTFKVFEHVLMAKPRVKELGWAVFVSSIANVIASYILSLHIGIWGVVIPTITYWLIIYPATMFYIMKTDTLYSFKEYVRSAYPSWIIIGLSIFLPFSPIGEADTWLKLIIKSVPTLFILIGIQFLISQKNFKQLVLNGSVLKKDKKTK